MRRLGDWFIFCDICGRRCYASETYKLAQYSGRGELRVCKEDYDKTDYGTVPYKIPTEKNIPWTRLNNLDTTDSLPIVDPETMTTSFYLASSQDNIVLTPSQDPSELLIVSESVL